MSDDGNTTKQLLQLEAAAVQTFHADAAVHRKYRPVQRLSSEVSFTRISLAECQDTSGYRAGAVRPICAQVLQGGRNQEQVETLLLQEAGRTGQDLPQFTALGDKRRRAAPVYRQRYDGILRQRRLLRTDVVYGSVEQRDRQPCAVLEARRPDDLHQRSGKPPGT